MKARVGLVLAVAASGVCAASAAASQERHHIDNQELFSLRSLKPEAVALLERGEERLSVGDLAGALDTFRDAEKAAPMSRIIVRRKCQTLALLGRRVEAMEDCQRTMQLGPTPLDFRAQVLAITAGAAEPTPAELADARLLAQVAARKLPNEPWGYAAACDVYAKLGDDERLRECTDELVRIDPNHYETRRALSRFVPRPARLWLGLGWAAMVSAGLGTLLHALVTRFRRSARNAGVAAIVLSSLGLAAAPARAAEPNVPSTRVSPPADAPTPGAATDADPGEGRYPVNDEDPASSVPTVAERNADPLEFGYFLINLTNKAGRAEQNKDYRTAIKYYLALAKAVPDEAVAFSKLCEYHELLKESAQAIEACRIAVTRHGASVGDYARFTRLIVSKPGAFTKDDQRGARGLIEYMKSNGAAADVVRQVECPFGLRVQDLKILDACARDFATFDPKSQTAVTYQWAVALAKGDFSRASELVKNAKAAGIQPVGIRDMERAISEARWAKWRRLLVDWKALLGLTAALGAVGAWLALRASAERSIPRPTAGQG